MTSLVGAIERRVPRRDLVVMTIEAGYGQGKERLRCCLFYGFMVRLHTMGIQVQGNQGKA